MAPGASGGPVRGANGRFGRGHGPDRAAGSREYGFFFFCCSGDEDMNHEWMRLSVLGRQMAPVTARLISAEEALCAANFAIVCRQEGAEQHRAEARAAYDAVYKEYLAACDRFVPGP